MTYMIAGVEVDYAWWGNPGHTSIILHAVDTNTYTMYDDSPSWGDIVSSGIVVRPHQASEYHTIWDSGNNEWDVDQTAFTTSLKPALSAQRNGKLGGTVTFNSVVANGTQQEVTLLLSIKEFLKSQNEDVEIDWKQPDDVFVKVKLSDVEGLAYIAGKRVQNAFSTENYILEEHSNTPYEFIQDALDAFDIYYDNLPTE